MAGARCRGVGRFSSVNGGPKTTHSCRSLFPRAGVQRWGSADIDKEFSEAFSRFNPPATLLTRVQKIRTCFAALRRDGQNLGDTIRIRRAQRTCWLRVFPSTQFGPL